MNYTFLNRKEENLHSLISIFVVCFLDSILKVVVHVHDVTKIWSQICVLITP